MKSCYIYSYLKEVEVVSKGKQMQNHLVIFLPYKTQVDIHLQLREYFHHHTIPDKLYILCFEFNKVGIQTLFEKGAEIYEYIPKFEFDDPENNICILSIDKSGSFSSVVGKLPSEKEINELYNRGLIKIFSKNGGLIISQSANHFVFPSGKHSNRFLRTGNVLINGSEIFFIASALIRHFKREKIENIYCDTSSINSLALAYINLLKELNKDFTESVRIESFGSYAMFEKLKFSAAPETIFLISSSTSGSILKRMTNKSERLTNIDLKDIVIIYGLNVNTPFDQQVLCDLTLNDKIPESFGPIKSYNLKKGEVCKFCEDGSKALKVEGDVFLLEKPMVTSYLIKKTDYPIYIRQFSAFYKKAKEDEPLIRCYYKENGQNDKKNEIYIDLNKLLQQWSNREDKSPHPYKPIFEKLEKYILQNIPASLKYMIVLPDEGSKLLAEIIRTVLNEHGFSFDKKNILGSNAEDIKLIDKSQKGSIAIVSSSIVSGRNLLYLSRALRDYEKTYQRVYFTFINRTRNKTQYDFLESNLGLGEFGNNTHKIFNVESIFCTSEAQKTPWHIEEDYIKKFQDFFEVFNEYKTISNYCDKRLIELSDSGKHKGLSNNLFFPNLKGNPLKLRNGFAFAPFASGSAHNSFILNSKQSEIYFIISSILNDLRNKGVLNQSEYVRNIIDPGNFVRYNDGIIQSCILRAALNEELNYSLSEEESLKMKSVLGDMILHLKDDHAEGLNEFFYALAIKKLKLTPGTLEDCIDLLEEQTYYQNNDSILKGLVKYIKSKVIIKETTEEKFKKLAKVET
jgi:hypothetical protein